MRYLLLAVFLASPAMASVTVNGTASADTISVGVLWCYDKGWSEVGPRKYVNGAIGTISVSTFENIFVNGLAGNDDIYIPNATDGDFDVGAGGGCTARELRPFAGQLLVDFYLDGGAGLDEIFGSDRADAISGGDDDDDLYGRGGNDYIYGNEGNDLMFGDAGNDLIIGDGDWPGGCFETDIDVGYGGAGDDEIYVGNTAYGESGSDYCIADIEYSCEEDVGPSFAICVGG